MATEKARTTAAFRGQWLDQVAADPQMSGAGLRFCIILSHYFNGEHGKAWASYDRMAQDFGIDRTAIIRGAMKAEGLGHVEIQRLGGQRGSDYIPLLNGTKIVSKEQEWSTRHQPRNGAKSSTANGARSSTIKHAAKTTANGGRSDPGMVDDTSFNGVGSSTLTFEEPLMRTLEVGAGLLAGPLPSPSSQIEPYDPASPFSDQGALPLRADDRRTDTGWEPDRSSPSPANPEDVWTELWDAWPWSDDKVEARSAFDSALHEASPQNLLDAYNRGEAGSGNDFTDMIGSILESLRRAA